MRLRSTALLGLALSGCTTVTVLPSEGDGLGGSDSSSKSATSSSNSNGTGAAGVAPMCELSWDWDVQLPLAPDETPTGVLAFAVEAGAVQLLASRYANDGMSSHHEIVTTRIEADGAAPIVSDPIVRGVLPYLDGYTRWTALPDGGFEIHQSSLLMTVPSGDGPAMTEQLDGYPRIAWDRSGGRYVTRNDDELGVMVEAPDGSVHELGPSCAVYPISGVGDGVAVSLGGTCFKAEDEAQRTFFISPEGAHEVDLTTVSWFGRGAEDRALGVGFLGHIMDIGAQGELGELVAENPWDGNTSQRVEVMPWLDGFAVVSMDQYTGDLRGLKVRAFPEYGARVESDLLDTGVFPSDDSFTAVVDPGSGGLLVAYRDAYNPRLARLSCNEVEL